MNFTALDFETANGHRGSPCSVGLVRVRDGVIVERAHYLMRPPEGADHFDDFNIALHGIGPGMVADQPRWAQRLPQIMNFIGDDIVVAHNAAFDTSVIRYACDLDGTAYPDMRFMCTLVLARRLRQLPSYRLPFVLDSYGLTMGAHHNALADAEAAAILALAMATENGAATLSDLAQQAGTSIGTMSANSYRGSGLGRTLGGYGPPPVMPGANPDADPDGYLYGKTVVFTGSLASMSRQDAWDAVAQAGGEPGKSTTRKTNILVVGDLNPASLRPGANVSGKAAKAFALQDKGQDIELMTEADFLQVLDGAGNDRFAG